MSEKEGEDEDEEDDDFGSLGLIMTSSLSLIRGIWDSFDSSFFLMMFIMLMLMSWSLSLLFDVLVLPSTLIIGIGADLFNRGAVSTLWTPVTVISSSTT